MRKSRFSEAQIVGVIKESEAGTSTAELCRRHGISTTTFYKWKSKFGGMDVSDVAKMRALEDENRRLKRIVADQVLHIDALKIIAEGNVARAVCLIWARLVGSQLLGVCLSAGRRSAALPL